MICISGMCVGPMFGLFAGGTVAITVIVIAMGIGQVMSERKDGKK